MCRLRLIALEKLKKFVLGELCDPTNLEQKQFRDFFKFTFLFSREGTHRTIEKDLVADLLPDCDLRPIVPRRLVPQVPRGVVDDACDVGPAVLVPRVQCESGAAPGFEGCEEDGAWPLLLDGGVGAQGGRPCRRLRCGCA